METEPSALTGGLFVFRFKPKRVRIGGEEHTFYVFPHPGAVGIVPWDGTRLALVRQLRPAINQAILEIPAGVLDPGEQPEVAAARELAEETGLRAQKLYRLGGLYAAPGYSAEYLHVFLATQLSPGEPDFDDGEEILELVWLTPDELTQRIAEGAVEDAKTIAALHLLQHHVASPRKATHS